MCSATPTETTSELVLSDDSFTKELQLYEICDKNVQFDNVALNIENSSDVIIGPVTQFNGPVTIYQNGIPIDDSKLTKSESNASDTLPEKPSILSNKPYVKYAAIPLLFITLIVIGVTIWMLVRDNKTVTDDDIEDSNGTSIGTHKIFKRDFWGGLPQRPGLRPLPHPTPLVIISHTVQDFCPTAQFCSMRVQSAQTYHMSELDSPDIGYNFLIGGDANIYVGRGYDYQNFHGIPSIGISFIGNYVFDELTDDMIECAQMLLDDAVKRNKLAKDYKLVGHNQTFATLSPGKNVYKIIKNWPHFSPEKVKKTV